MMISNSPGNLREGVKVPSSCKGNRMSSSSLLNYSYLRASTGRSRDARHTGYSPKTAEIITPNASAPRRRSGVTTGVIAGKPERPPPKEPNPPIPLVRSILDRPLPMRFPTNTPAGKTQASKKLFPTHFDGNNLVILT